MSDWRRGGGTLDPGQFVSTGESVIAAMGGKLRISARFRDGSECEVRFEREGKEN